MRGTAYLWPILSKDAGKKEEEWTLYLSMVLSLPEDECFYRIFYQCDHSNQNLMMSNNMPYRIKIMGIYMSKGWDRHFDCAIKVLQ